MTIEACLLMKKVNSVYKHFKISNKPNLNKKTIANIEKTKWKINILRFHDSDLDIKKWFFINSLLELKNKTDKKKYINNSMLFD